MSHFTKLKTEFKDIDSIKKALADLGYRYEHVPNQQLTIAGFADSEEVVELAIRTGTRYDVGFRKATTAYEVVADWWGVERHTELREETFVGSIMQRYAYHKTVSELETHDFYIDNEVEEEGTIILTVKW